MLCYQKIAWKDPRLDSYGMTKTTHDNPRRLLQFRFSKPYFIRLNTPLGIPEGNLNIVLEIAWKNFPFLLKSKIGDMNFKIHKPKRIRHSSFYFALLMSVSEFRNAMIWLISVLVRWSFSGASVWFFTFIPRPSPPPSL